MGKNFELKKKVGQKSSNNYDTTKRKERTKLLCITVMKNLNDFSFFNIKKNMNKLFYIPLGIADLCNSLFIVSNCLWMSENEKILAIRL